MPKSHPNIYQGFLHEKLFSNIGIDQANEQNNKLVKIDNGIVDIFLNINTDLMKWVVGGPEIVKIVKSFRS